MREAPLATSELSLAVEVELDGEAMRGRPGYRSGVRPNHMMPGRDYFFIGQLDFIDRDLLRPGEKCKASGLFVIAEQDRVRFISGFSWMISEGAKIVGRCRILDSSV
jgi:hypothetical protein